MKNLFNSLFVRLALLGSCGVLVSVLALGSYIAYHQRQLVVQSAQQEINLISIGLANALVADVIVKNYSGIEQTVIQATAHPLLSHIKVANMQGVIIIDAIRDQNTDAWQYQHGGTVELPKTAALSFILDDNKIVAWVPITAGDVVGWVWSEMSLAQSEILQRQIIVDTFMVAFLSAGFSIILIVFNLGKPIGQIKKATHFADKLSAHYGETLQVSSSLTEVQLLISALNNTSEKLYDQDQDLKMLLALIEYTDDPIYILDKDQDFRMIFANQAACRHFGLEKEVLLTLKLTDWDVDIDLTKLAEFSDKLAKKGHLTFTSHHKLVNGDIVPVEISANYFRFNNRDLIAGYFRNIQSRVNAELELTKSRDAAQQAAKAKSEFLANMSHEIRTPMSAIIGLTHLALNQSMHSELRQYLETISTSSQSLLAILNDILEFSKLEAVGVNIKSAAFNLNLMVKQLSNLFEIAAANKELDFDVSIDALIPEKIVGDAIRIQQILSNLIGNAIKFTAHGFVRLKISIIQLTETNVTLNFAVVDSGIGMTNQDIEKLFLPFSQADGSISRRFGGTGLGLAISQGLLTGMGGAFKVNSTPNVGTTMSFVLSFDIVNQALLPYEKLPENVKAGELAQVLKNLASNLKGSQILIAEDNQVNQKLICEFLNLSGLTALVANNGLEVLEILETCPIDVILMDIQMPIMDGIEATRRLRLNEKYHNLPVIALTAGVTEAERERYFKVGMNDFIAKPVNPKVLITVLTKWLVL